MLQRGLIFVIPNALAKSLMGFGDDQGGNVQKLVTSADCAHLSSNAVWYTDCLKTTNEETSEDKNENDPGQQLRMEKRVIPRRLKETRWDKFTAFGWDLFKIENGHNILVEAIVEEIAIKGKKEISKKFENIFINDFVKIIQKFTKAKIPTVSTGLQKYFVGPIVNFVFGFMETGVTLFFFGGLQNGKKKTNYGFLVLASWNKKLRARFTRDFEKLVYQMIKKVYPPAFNFAESIPDKVIALFVEKVGPVKYFLKKIALSLYSKKIDDTCANSGKDQCASPTPVCEWNPKTDKCGIRESLLLEQSKDLLSWVFWKIGFKHFIDFLKKKLGVEEWYNKIPYLPVLEDENGNTLPMPSATQRTFAMQLAVWLLALEFLSPLIAESKKIKGTAEEKSEEKPEEKSTEEPEEEPEELPRGTPKEKTEEKPEE